MKYSILHTLQLFLMLISGMLATASCTFGDDLDRCPYNVRMEYWYAGSGVENTLPIYVDNLQQYLFDGGGRLLSISTLRGDSVASWQGSLPDGDYTLVLWGNISDEAPKREVIENGAGIDQANDTGGNAMNDAKLVRNNDINDYNDMNMETMTLTSRRNGVPPAYRENTDHLYYGVTSFSIHEGMTERRRVYLSHAHASLSITVVWQTEEQPVQGIYRMRLKGVPSTYGFTGGMQEAVPSGDGTYSLPRVDRPVTYHETRAALNYEKEVTGQFVTFRYTAATHPLWSLWCDGKQIVKDLDLYRFFRKLPMNMDTNMEQEFDLLVTVYEDKVVVTQASATDWDEGGAIG